jgi:hypothetical protein
MKEITETRYFVVWNHADPGKRVIDGGRYKRRGFPTEEEALAWKGRLEELADSGIMALNDIDLRGRTFVLLETNRIGGEEG